MSAVLFLCLFAGQAAAIALSPVLTEVAQDMSVSTAVAGQLRTIAGLVAGVTALSLGRVGRRVGLGRQLLGGALLLAVGSLGSAAAPDLAVLALLQVPLGAGIAIMTTAGTLAAAEWVEPDRRSHVLSWALIGQPAAWIVGMPLIGFVGGHNWRYSWLTMPLVAALLAAAAVRGRDDPPSTGAVQARLRPVLADATLTRWLAAELLANSAWAGMLVYAGGLLVESYGATTAVASIVLAFGASAYVAGNLTFRRATERDARSTLVVLSLVLAAVCVLFGAFRTSLVVSGVLFSVAGFAAGGRTLVSSAFGLRSPAEFRTASMSIRAATMQLGYFAGSFAAGTALAFGGYPALGVTVGVGFAGAAATLVDFAGMRPTVASGRTTARDEPGAYNRPLDSRT